MVKVETPPCMACGRRGSVEMTEEQFAAFVAVQRDGTLIQIALPEVAPPIREQLRNGTHPECWDFMFGRAES